MKIQDITDNYCRLYGVDAPKINVTETQYFVTISSIGSSVLPLHKPSKLLGQVIGGALKRGTVLYVNNGRDTLITWDNWKTIWGKLFTTKPRKNSAPEPNTVHPYKSQMFEEGQNKRRSKKPARKGFECTFRANTNMNLLGLPKFQITPLG